MVFGVSCVAGGVGVFFVPGVPALGVEHGGIHFAIEEDHVGVAGGVLPGAAEIGGFVGDFSGGGFVVAGDAAVEQDVADGGGGFGAGGGDGDVFAVGGAGDLAAVEDDGAVTEDEIVAAGDGAIFEIFAAVGGVEGVLEASEGAVDEGAAIAHDFDGDGLCDGVIFAPGGGVGEGEVCGGEVGGGDGGAGGAAGADGAGLVGLGRFGAEVEGEDGVGGVVG